MSWLAALAGGDRYQEARPVYTAYSLVDLFSQIN